MVGTNSTPYHERRRGSRRVVLHPPDPSGAFVTALWRAPPNALHSPSTHEPFEIAASFSEYAPAIYERFSRRLSDALERAYSASQVLPILPQVIFGRSSTQPGSRAAGHAHQHRDCRVGRPRRA